MAAPKNAIERRLDVLHDQWLEFAEQPEARLFCWALRDDETRMVEAFLAAENDDRAGSLPDVFIELESAFGDPAEYGQALLAELSDRVARSREESPDEVSDWSPPPAAEDREDDVLTLMAACSALIAAESLPGLLVLVLRPRELSDPDSFVLWLQRLVQIAPEGVRALVFDAPDESGCAALSRAEPLRVVRRLAELDMPRALAELSREAGHLDTPGGQFRQLFIAIGGAIGQQDLPTARSHAERALAIAHAEGLHYLAVPVHFALGSASTAAEDHVEAISQYRAAERACQLGQHHGQDYGRDVCKKLLPQARLALGSALIAAEAYPRAAEVFEIAVEQAEPRTQLDAWRLAAFCHERAGDDTEAWRCAVAGLHVARNLDAQLLEVSTFPYLGELLLRLSRRGGRRSATSTLERELASIAGRPDWHPQPGAAARATREASVTEHAR